MKMENILTQIFKFKFKVYELSSSGNFIQYNASINRTFVIIYKQSDLANPSLPQENNTLRLIFNYEYRGFYKVIYNTDFNILFGNENSGIKINLLLTTSDNKKEFYTYVGKYEKWKLFFLFKRFWIQKEDNIRWLMEIIISLVVTIATIYTVFKKY